MFKAFHKNVVSAQLPSVSICTWFAHAWWKSQHVLRASVLKHLAHLLQRARPVEHVLVFKPKYHFVRRDRWFPSFQSPLFPRLRFKSTKVGGFFCFIPISSFLFFCRSPFNSAFKPAFVEHMGKMLPPPLGCRVELNCMAFGSESRDSTRWCADSPEAGRTGSPPEDFLVAYRLPRNSPGMFLPRFEPK